MFEFLGFFQFIPLTAFVAYAKYYDLTVSAWQGAFIFGACIALFELLVFAYHGIPTHNFILAINLFLCIGGAAFYFEIPWLLDVLAHLQQTMLFVCLFVVGLVTTFFSSTGFIQVAGQPAARTRFFSYLLLAGALGALIFSYISEGEILFAGYFAYFALLTYRMILARAIKW